MAFGCSHTHASKNTLMDYRSSSSLFGLCLMAFFVPHGNKRILSFFLIFIFQDQAREHRGAGGHLREPWPPLPDHAVVSPTPPFVFSQEKTRIMNCTSENHKKKQIFGDCHWLMLTPQKRKILSVFRHFFLTARNKKQKYIFFYKVRS